ncbi:MAG: hypothetical protein WCD35_12270 [Mycobacteriales bacterium]
MTLVWALLAVGWLLLSVAVTRRLLPPSSARRHSHRLLVAHQVLARWHRPGAGGGHR